jgi:hypothetical protein
MEAKAPPPNGLLQLVQVRPEPPGQYTAQVVGLPDLRATAATREQAIEQVRTLFVAWVASGRLALMEVAARQPQDSPTGPVDSDDLLEREFLEDLDRFRREDLERTLKECGEECPSSSSTPTT